MSKSMWTDEQLEAINSRGSNLLVAAAAGSGKTAVLVERIIKIITDEENPVDIDRLLVVTFTNAAASEMRERVGKAISEKLYKNPNSKIIQRQLALLNKAKITTIHSFCLDVIKNNFHYVDIDPDFRIGDETEMLLLKNETLDELFEEKYLEAQEDSSSMFIKLLESYCSNRDDSALFEIVMNLYNFAMSNPWPYEWINSMAEKFNIDESFEFGKSEWADVLLSNINMELVGMKRAILNAINIIENEPTLENYLENYKEDANMLDDLIMSSCDYSKLYMALNDVSFKTLKRCGKEVNKEKQKLVKDIRDNVKKKLSDIALNILSEDETSIKNEINKLYPLMRALGELVTEFNEKYKENKSKKNIIDFNDFEHMCLEILTEKDGEGNIKPSKAALEIRGKYDEILIDEYQDSNLVQEVIMGTISRKYTDNPNLFMVGDVKQSIYRFRKANPKLFLEKYNTYEKDEKAKNRKILLYKNFRSRKEILDGVNFIFKQIMSPMVGEMDYTSSEFLNPGAKYKEFEKGEIDKSIELYVIEKSKEETETEDEEDDVSDIMLEARAVGKRILEMTQNDEEDKNFFVFDKESDSYRKAQFKDIVILLRSTKKWSGVFLDEFKKMCIPVFADSNSGYFESPEIKTMLSLLQVIDNPMQDIPFAAVLKSPIGGFSVEELIDIKSFAGDTFYEKFKSGMEKCSEENSNELCIKISYFIEKLNKWRKEALYMPIDEFIWHLYTETGYYGYAGAVKGGMQRQANLRLLFQKAKIYSETSYKGLFNFINFINKIKVTSGDMGSAKILGENENVVRIMSIHKSKGLEFPIVFVAGCGKNFNLMDMNKTILFHNELGFGPDYVDLEKRVSYGTLMKEAIRNKIKLETLSEEMRILYVAFTRAKEKLIITGLVASLEKAVSKWASAINSSSEKISEDIIVKGKSYLDWICSAVMRHKDALVLRENVSEEIQNAEFIDDESKWKISLLKRQEVIDLWRKEEEKEKLDKIDLFYNKLEEIKNSTHESKYFDEIIRRLNYKYRYKKAAKLPSLISVTELKRQFSEQDDSGIKVFMPALSKKPTFLEEIKGLTAAEKGTVLHSVMQHLNFNGDSGKINIENIENQIGNMIFREIITDKEAKTVNTKRILKFLQSDIGKRIINAKNVYKEFPFQFRIKGADIYEDLEKDLYEKENIIVQGIIDLYFEEDDGLVLLDYKTDYVKDDDIDIIKERYKMQIEYYSTALETITGVKVKEKYLYLFYNGVTVKM